MSVKLRKVNNGSNKVDILLSTYNGSEFLKDLLNSIITQSYTNWQLIVRDDGSSDETTLIINKFQMMYPDKLKVLNDSYTHLGPSQSFCKLMEQSEADYVMLCDQDDIWFKNKISITMKMMKSLEMEFPNTPLLVHTDLKVVDMDLSLVSESLWDYQKLNPNKNALDDLLIQNVVTGCTMMINKALKDIAYPIPPHAVMHDWWISLVASVYSGIYHINEPTILYRQHSNNDTGAKKYSLCQFYSQIGNINNIMRKIMGQGLAFKERYEHNITINQSKQLKLFIQIGNSKGFFRALYLFRVVIKKHGILRKLGSIVIVLTHWDERFGYFDNDVNGRRIK